MDHFSKELSFNQENIPRLEIGVECLKNCLKEIAQELRLNNILVDDECRIDPSFFVGYYPKEKILADQKRMEALQKKIEEERERRSLEKRPFSPTKEEPAGRLLEMLKTVIFHKFLNRDFFICRSSLVDDSENGVDNVILEKKTGHVICAFDEVADAGGGVYQNKVKEIIRKNVYQGGARLKYGLIFDQQKKKFVPQALSNLPIFYLALPENYVYKGVKQATPLGEISEFEKELFFKYFLHSLKIQIEELKFKNLAPQLSERLNLFEQTLKKILAS